MSLDQQKDLDSLGSEQLPSLFQDTHSENQDEDPATWHLMFREFISEEHCDPIQDLRLISTLCHQWLRPDLHTKEEILQQLVMEQFMISVPQEVQVLVKESGVKTYKDLERVLGNRKEPKKWSIVVFEGKTFLLQDSEAELVKAKADEEPSQEGHSAEREESLSQGQASTELQSPSGIEEPSSCEGEEVLPETIPEKEDPEYLKPKQTLKEPMEDRDKGTALKPWELELPQSPGSVWEQGEKMPQGVLNMDAVTTPCRALERRDLSQNSDLQNLISLKTVSSDNSLNFQGEREYMAKPVSPVESGDHPMGQKAGAQTRFGCIVCGKRFSYKSQLIIHMRSHTGERPFQCGFCKKGFLQSSDLRVHQRTHTGEKPYKCKFCDKVFAHESTLLGHNRVHTKEKPFRCGDCHKRFSHKGNLNVHSRIHTNLRPYTCKECGSTFRQHGTFKRHLSIHLRKE
ncbi:zinc finger and SCAN domain-containing protein 5B [Nannospalax galili]|uniref:zinc finger and SCAN domain-containing protein 5B n=1 Tax=Nannospalax galili TaxID=1026970 RepID=UPI0004ED66F1|nr:zinc finger and SCAN domain-containing protein 5B [Nannospalax galili]